MTEEFSELLLAQQGDAYAMERIITKNSGLIWAVARRLYGRGTEIEDLYQIGCIGFIKAVKGFDPAFGTRFSTYAVPKIAGEIRRFLRDDGTVKVSRTLKERSAAIKAERSRLLGALGREPTLIELSEALDLSAEEIAGAELSAAPVQSLQSEFGESGITLETVLGDCDCEERMLNGVCLQQAISQLPERERQVILLRYYHDLTQEKTAGFLGVSQVQISRIERSAILALRAAFSA